MLDADDWLSLDALKMAYEALKKENAQCAVLELVEHYEEDGHEEVYPIRSTKQEWSGEEAFRLSLGWLLHGLYVAERSLYERFPYDDTCRLYSDENTTRLHYLHSEKVVRCLGRYYYRKHAASLTTACSIHRFDSMCADVSMKRQLESLSFADKQSLLDFYECHRWLNLIDSCWYYYLHQNAFNVEEQKEIGILMKQIYQSIECQRLPWSLKCKFGYYPFRSYRAFCFWERVYFRMRKFLGR
jgi:hypothetical protein